MERFIADLRVRELQAAAQRAQLERVVRELYGDEQAARAVDRGLFARYVWSGLHLSNPS